ncbi:hypothetical protein [Variovorax guangxiensis]|uniref:hypothetical protein n=1 Tax=Variovorax guangxiensis TaxID=1775474 RepID=UPI002857BBE8|nr:hypothetical protein [Variovorax guangxiensis]MDR6859524.1 hypothetical protein [Variovorax guangxiensis]
MKSMRYKSRRFVTQLQELSDLHQEQREPDTGRWGRHLSLIALAIVVAVVFVVVMR